MNIIEQQFKKRIENERLLAVSEVLLTVMDTLKNNNDFSNYELDKFVADFTQNLSEKTQKSIENNEK